jgi:sugar phosphate isomerase/epimerase
MTIAERMTFMAGCLARTPFRQQVAAVSAAGFDSMTSWPNIWRHAQRKDGLTLTDMRTMLDDHALVLTDVDGCTDWVPVGTDGPVGPMSKVTPRHDFFEACAALGGSTVVAVHPGGAFVRDREIEGFATLCDDAAAHGLRVALEFVSFTPIGDVATAWDVVSAAGRTNAGLVVDTMHHLRTTADNEALRRVPPERVFTVQLCDGPRVAPADLTDEAINHRAYAGDGELDVAGVIATLNAMGVRASVGAEVYRASSEDRPPADVAKEVYDHTVGFLERAQR